MSKKAYISIAFAIAAVLLFGACERSASQPMLATPTVKGAKKTAQATNVLLVQSWQTVTANFVQTQVALGTFTAAPANQMPVASPTPNPLGSLPTPTPVGGVLSTPVPGNTPVIVVPTATPGRPATYTVHAGEFAYCLARRFDVNPGDLLSLNGLSDGQVIQPGLSLKIPQAGFFPGNRALHPHPAQYTVAVNDSFYSVACYFGDVDPSSIAAANGLTLASPLTTGRILNIP